MSCTACSKSYGLLVKEVGCEECGFSFCTKCCSKKAMKGENDETVNKQICNACCNKTSSEKFSTMTHSPPMAHKKRMAQLNRQDSASSANEMDKEIAKRLQKLKRERSKDIGPSQSELEERLAKLKGMDPAKFSAPPLMVYRPDKRSSTEQATDLIKQLTEEVHLDNKREKPEEEIAARLARLQDKPVPQPYVYQLDKCSDSDQATDLIKQVTEKLYLENIGKNPEEVAAQMTRLQNQPVLQTAEMQNVDEYSASSSHLQLESMDIDKEFKSYFESSKNLEKEALKLVSSEKNWDAKATTSNRKKTEKEEFRDSECYHGLIDANSEKLLKKLYSIDLCRPDSSNISDKEIDVTTSDDSEGEFFWCGICTKDAIVRCFDCEGELYCKKCFVECHDNLDICDHKTYPVFQNFHL